MTTKDKLKLYFKNKNIPVQEEFWEWIDSYWHKEEKIPLNNIDIDLSTKADLVNGKVPATQLPSYVDDVLEFSSLSMLPSTGESDKIYITTDNNKLYRWTGTRYVDITQGDVGTLQAVTERGKETNQNVKIQGIYFGGLDYADNIIIGDESSYVNNRAGNTIAIGKNTKPEGSDHLVIGNTAAANNTNGSIGNTVVGNFAMMQSPSSSENSVFGYNTFSNGVNAFGNVVFGAYSGMYCGESLVQNTILGYNAGNGLGTGSYNNIIIGSNSGFGNATVQNKLYIHCSNSNSLKSVTDALISGDFSDRYVNINGNFSVTPGKMPSADSSYTKNIVAKPDGTFGWENKIDYIPLTGTLINKPVTGDIIIDNNTNQAALSAGSIGLYDASGSEVALDISGIKFAENGSGTLSLSKTGVDINDEVFTVACQGQNPRGLSGFNDYTNNINSLDYVQKVYVDKKQSYSTTEVKTGGTWIDGKPIYKKTVFYDTIPQNGVLEIYNDFEDVKTIVSNQMFTEWWANDTAFAGSQWDGELFIGLNQYLVKFRNIKIPNGDYSTIDSFTLTLEYTKITD